MGRFLTILSQVGNLALGPTAGYGSISLKFLLETRLKSGSFEPLISFLAFLV